MEPTWVNRVWKISNAPLRKAGANTPHVSAEPVAGRRGDDEEGEGEGDHDWGACALYAAALHGELEIAELLLDAGAHADRLNGPFGISALHLCASKGLTHFCDVLLRRGASVDRFSPTYGTALHIAVAKSHRFVAQVLLEHGASVNVRTPSGNESVLHIAARLGDALMVRQLIASAGDTLNAGAKDEEGNTALHLAVFAETTRGHVPGRVVNHGNASGENAEAVALMLIDQFPDLVYVRNSEGQTPMYYADPGTRAALKRSWRRKFSGFVELIDNGKLRRKSSDVRVTFRRGHTGSGNTGPLLAHSAILSCRGARWWEERSLDRQGHVQLHLDASEVAAAVVLYYLYSDSLPPRKGRLERADLDEIRQLALRWGWTRLAELAERAKRRWGTDDTVLVDEVEWEVDLNRHAEFFREISALRTDAAHFDLAISTTNDSGGQRGEDIRCNSTVLLRHQYFRALAQFGFHEEGDANDEMRVVLEHTTPATVRALVEFSCTWQIRSLLEDLDSADMADAAGDTIVDLFELSSRLTIDELRHSCEELIADRIMSEENVLYLLQLADAHHTLFLREECFEFACFHFDSIAQSPQFEQLPEILRDALTAASRRRRSRSELLDSSEAIRASRTRATPTPSHYRFT
jgi:Ankyrin repeats (3 copies)